MSLPITVEFPITPEKIRSLVLQLDPKNQFAVMAAIINKKSKTKFEDFSQSDIRLLRGYLETVLIEIEQIL